MFFAFIYGRMFDGSQGHRTIPKQTQQGLVSMTKPSIGNLIRRYFVRGIEEKGGAGHKDIVAGCEDPGEPDQRRDGCHGKQWSEAG